MPVSNVPPSTASLASEWGDALLTELDSTQAAVTAADTPGRTRVLTLVQRDHSQSLPLPQRVVDGCEKGEREGRDEQTSRHDASGAPLPLLRGSPTTGPHTHTYIKTGRYTRETDRERAGTREGRKGKKEKKENGKRGG